MNTYQTNVYQELQLDALGDATRRAILARLLDGPLAVGELARHFPVSRPAISQHLRILKDANLVLDRAQGTRRLYALNPEGFDTLREYFDQFWSLALDAFKKKAEEHPSGTGGGTGGVVGDGVGGGAGAGARAGFPGSTE